MEIYLVIESNGESYEDYQEWPIAAFDDEDKAKEYASKQQIAYDAYYAEGQANYVLAQEEESNLFAILPEDTKGLDVWDIEGGIYEYTHKLYPNIISQYETIHTFSVSKPIPFNPS